MPTVPLPPPFSPAEQMFLTKWHTPETSFSYEDFFFMVDGLSPARFPYWGRSLLYDFLEGSHQRLLESGGAGKEQTVNKLMAEIFLRYFGGKGISKILEMLMEVYEEGDDPRPHTHWFHRFITRRSSKILLESERQKRGQKGQCLLRFAMYDYFEAGCLCLDGLPTNMQGSPYCGVIQFNKDLQAYIIGDGTDGQGNPKSYKKLKHIYQENRNVLPYPIAFIPKEEYYPVGTLFIALKFPTPDMQYFIMRPSFVKDLGTNVVNMFANMSILPEQIPHFFKLIDIKPGNPGAVIFLALRPSEPIYTLVYMLVTRIINWINKGNTVFTNDTLIAVSPTRFNGDYQQINFISLADLTKLDSYLQAILKITRSIRLPLEFPSFFGPPLPLPQAPTRPSSPTPSLHPS